MWVGCYKDPHRCDCDEVIIPQVWQRQNVYHTGAMKTQQLTFLDTESKIVLKMEKGPR